MVDFIQDPSNPTKMIPGSLPNNAFQEVQQPAVVTVVDRPDRVYIVDDADEDIYFEFASGSGYLKFYDVSEAAATSGNVERLLPISPTSWSGSATAVVNFIYDNRIS